MRFSTLAIGNKQFPALFELQTSPPAPVEWFLPPPGLGAFSDLCEYSTEPWRGTCCHLQHPLSLWLSSPVVCQTNSSCLGSPGLSAPFSTWGDFHALSRSPSLHPCLETFSRQETEAITELISLGSCFWGIIIFPVLMFNVLRAIILHILSNVLFQKEGNYEP